MESQLHRQDDPQYGGLHPVVEEEQHHEKKSVLKKVKDKAKKIKNTIKKRGQGGQSAGHDEHEPEHEEPDYRGSDPDDDEGDDDDLMEEDPAVHSSSAYKPGGIGSDTYGGHSVDSEKPSALREDHPYPKQVNEPTSGYGGQDINFEKPTALREDKYPKQVDEPISGYGGQGVNLEKPTALREDKYPLQVNDPTSGSGYASGRPLAAEPERSPPSLPNITGHRAAEPEGRTASSFLTGETGPRATELEGRNTPSLTDKIGGLTDLRDAPTPMDSSNYQSKTGDTSGKGGREADIDPLIRSLEKARIHDESGDQQSSSPAFTGSHDQFAPESQNTSKTEIGSDSFPKTHDSSKPEGLPHDTIQGKASDQGSYIGMITGVPSAISGKAIAAKNAVASKLGYGGTESAKSPGSESPTSTGSYDHSAPLFGSDYDPNNSDHTKPRNLPQDTIEGKPLDQGSYIGKVAGVPSTIAGTAIAAKNVVASKLGYGGTDSVKAPESGVRESTGSNDQFTLAPDSLPTDKIYDSSKSEDRPQDKGSYVGKIAAVPSTIAGTAVAAKNVVASKLGYGGTESATGPEPREFVGAEKTSPSTISDKAIAAKNVVASKLGYGGGTESATTLETGEKSPSSTPYMQGVASKVTDTLAPVYAKVADTGSSVISRVTGTGNKDETKQATGDKVVSIKDYLSEKFRPGEEDQALSRDISDALHVRKETLIKTGEPKLVGKVVDATEGQSTILAEAKKDGDDVKVAGPENVNKGVVDYVKDTVSSWVGKGGQQQQQTEGSPKSHTTTEGQAAGEIEHPLSVSEEKKLD